MEIDFSWMDDLDSPDPEPSKFVRDQPAPEQEHDQWQQDRHEYDSSLWSSVDPAGSVFNPSRSSILRSQLPAAPNEKKDGDAVADARHVDKQPSNQQSLKKLHPPKEKAVKVGNFFASLFFGSSLGSSSRSPPSPSSSSSQKVENSRLPQQPRGDDGGGPMTPPLSEPSSKHGLAATLHGTSLPPRKPFNAAEVALLRKFLGPSTRTALLQRPKASASSGAILQGLGIQLCQMQSGQDIDRDVCELSEIAPMSVAEKTNILFAGDVLIEVNGTFVVRWSLDKIVMILVAAGKDIVLKVTTSEALSRAISRLAEQMCEQTETDSLSSTSSCHPNDSTSDDSTLGSDALHVDLGLTQSSAFHVIGQHTQNHSRHHVDDSSSDSSHSSSPLLQSIQIPHGQKIQQKPPSGSDCNGLYGGRFWEDAPRDPRISAGLNTGERAVDATPVLHHGDNGGSASDADCGNGDECVSTAIPHVVVLDVDNSQDGAKGTTGDMPMTSGADGSTPTLVANPTTKGMPATLPASPPAAKVSSTAPMMHVNGDSTMPGTLGGIAVPVEGSDPNELMACADMSMEQLQTSLAGGEDGGDTATDDIVAAWNACAVMQPAVDNGVDMSPALMDASMEDCEGSTEDADSRIIPILGGDSLDLSGIEYLSDEHENGQLDASDAMLSSVSVHDDGCDAVMDGDNVADGNTLDANALDANALDANALDGNTSGGNTSGGNDQDLQATSHSDTCSAGADDSTHSTSSEQPTESEVTSSATSPSVDNTAERKDYGFYVKLPPKKGKGRANPVKSAPSGVGSGGANNASSTRQGFFSRIFSPTSKGDDTKSAGEAGSAVRGFDAQALAQLPANVNSTNSIFIDERRVARDIVKLQRTGPARSPSATPNAPASHHKYHRSGVSPCDSPERDNRHGVNRERRDIAAHGHSHAVGSPLRPTQTSGSNFSPAGLVMIPLDHRRTAYPHGVGDRVGPLVPHLQHTPSVSGKPAGLRLKDDDDAATPARGVGLGPTSMADQLRRVAALGDCSKVAAVLVSAGLDKYIDLFEEEEIDFETLLSLTEADLEKIGIDKLGARRKLLRAIRVLDPWGGSEADSDCTASEYSYRSRSVVPRTLAHQRALSGSETSLSSRATTAASERGYFGGDNAGSGLPSPHAPVSGGRHQSPMASPQHDCNAEKNADSPFLSRGTDNQQSDGVDARYHHYMGRAIPDDCISVDTNDGVTDL